MAVNWLKGLVAPAAQFAGGQHQPGPYPQPVPQGGPYGNAPPVGGGPHAFVGSAQPHERGPNPYGVQPAPAPQPTAPPAVPDPMQWSTGTRTQGSVAGIAGGADPRVAALEARCAELANDVASLALFARTLLTMLEDGKVVTREQFVETKNRLDALDGKIDDR